MRFTVTLLLILSSVSNIHKLVTLLTYINVRTIYI